MSTSFGFETTASKGEWTMHFHYSSLGPTRVLTVQGSKFWREGAKSMPVGTCTHVCTNKLIMSTIKLLSIALNAVHL